MTGVLQWRKTTWVLLLWGGYVPAWAVITDSGPAIVALWWLAGAIVFGVLSLGTQLLSRQGRGFSRIFSRPRRANWRVVDLRQAHEATECRRDEDEASSCAPSARGADRLLCVQVRAGARRAVCR